MLYKPNTRHAPLLLKKIFGSRVCVIICLALITINTNVISAQIILDTSFNQFNPKTTIDITATAHVINDVKQQSDGKYIVVGRYRALGSDTLYQIVRLNYDGSIDTTFHLLLGARLNSILTLYIKPDDRIVVGGNRMIFNNIEYNGLLGLNKDGTLDTVFNNKVRTAIDMPFGSPHRILKILPTTGNKLILTGTFRSFTGRSTFNIACINSDGTLDTQYFTSLVLTDTSCFQCGWGIRSATINHKDELYIGTTLSNRYIVNELTYTNKVFKLKSNGTLDTTFNEDLNLQNSYAPSSLSYDTIRKKLYITFINGIYNGLFQLDTLGKTDTTLIINAKRIGDPNITIATINSIKPHFDTSILIVGVFDTINGYRFPSIARMLKNGAMDTSFTSLIKHAPDKFIKDFLIDSSGNLVIFGGFRNVNGKRHSGLSRFFMNNCSFTPYSTHQKKTYCKTGLETLNGRMHYTHYLWNTGDTTPSFTPDTSGIYWVRSIRDTCIKYDTFEINILHPVSPFNTSQQNICSLNDYILTADTNIYHHFAWRTGDTTSTIQITQTGWYHVVAHNEACSVSDSVFVNIVHETQQSNDTGICVLTTLVLQARPADSYLWSTGDTLSHTTVSLPGKYSVRRSISGCKLIDSFLVINYPTPTSSILDTIICKGTPVQLKAGAANTYQWNTGDTAAHIIVVAAGMYCAIKQVPPCQGIDSFRVQHFTLPQITSVNDTTVCFDEVKQILLDAGQFAKYLWEPTGETTRTIYSNTAQVYKLTVTDSNTCVSSKDFAVMEECPYSLYIPNAFTPNGDGINDEFKLRGLRIDDVHIRIFDRWGQRVYESTEMTGGWDGKGYSDGVYTVWVKYSALGKTRNYKGTVTLLR